MRLSRAELWPRFLGVLCISLSLGVAEPYAQSISHQDPSLENGFKPYGAYDEQTYDTVNLANGNVIVDIPFLSFPQIGGQLTLDYHLYYTGKQWNIFNAGPSIQYWGLRAPNSLDPIYMASQQYNLGTIGVNIIDPQYAAVATESWQVPTYSASTPTILFKEAYVVDGRGGTHPLALNATGGFRAVDTSGYFVTGNVTPQTGSIKQMTFNFQSLYDRHGVIVGAGGRWDSNGNTITYTAGNVIDDSVGRKIPAPSFFQDISSFQSIGTTTNSTGCSGSLPITAAYNWSIPAIGSSAVQTYKFCYVTLSLATNFKPYIGPGVQEGSATSVVLQSIVMPDLTTWTFQYSDREPGDPPHVNYGTLTQMTTPAGVTISYVYGMLQGCPLYSRGILSRTVNLNDGSPAQVWHYNIVSGGSTTVTDPLLNDTVHSFLGVCTLDYETKTQYYSGSAQSGDLPLKTVTTAYTTTPNVAVYIPNTMETVNVLPQSVTTSLDNGTTSTVQYSYDQGFSASDPNNAVIPGSGNTTSGSQTYSLGDRLSVTDSDFGTEGAGTAGPILRATQTTYLWQQPAVGVGYVLNNLVSLPFSVVSQDGDSKRVAETDYSYDQNNGSPQGNFGNLTSVSRWNNNGPVHTSSSVFNSQGVATLTSDANGNKTYFASFQCSGLFPQQVIRPYQSSTTVPETTSYSYDCNASKLLSTTDPNGVVTQYTYNDPLLRLTLTQMAKGTSAETWISMSYPSLTQINVSKDQYTKGDGILQSSIVYDGLGRTIHQTGPSGATVDTTYDLAGRVYTVSNPHLAASLPTDGLTTTSYDALDRPLFQYHPDHTFLQWTYGGNITQLYDETGVHSQQARDALGRLTQVLEPNGGTTLTVAPTLETDYVYDALDNLQTVTQHGASTDTPRVRSFSYDSLSRLLTSINPESGIICYGTWSGGAVGSGSCNGGYDANGNLVAKTDARGIITRYTYDALNRLYATSYFNASGQSTSDPSVFMQYDRPAAGGSDSNPIGRMTLEWTGPASTSPSSSSSVTSVPTGALTSTVVLAHDAMGRVTSEQQCPVYPCSTGYPFSYLYDLAGNVTQWNNGMPGPNTAAPPVLVWTASYDGAGRTSGVQTAAQPWASSTTYPSQLVNLALTGSTPSYDAFGHVVNEQAAIYPSNSGSPGLGITSAYDNRGRIVSETGQGLVSSNAARPSVGQISVTGIEAAPITAQAAPGSTTFSVTGADATHIVCVTKPGPVIDGGKVQSPPITTCTFVPDAGSLAVTVGSFTSTVSFNSASSDASVASAVAAGFNVSGSPVSATANGSSVTITANTTGSATNYPISFSNLDGFVFSDPNASLTGGQNGSSTYDSGTITATITNTSVTPSVSYTTSPISWGQGTLSAALATNLAAAINTAAGSLVTASASGSTIKLTSVGTGAATNYTVSVNSADTAPSTFPAASFNAQAGSMSGGAAAATNDGTIYRYSVPSGGYAANGDILSHSDSVMGDWNFSYDTLNRITSGTAASGPYAGLWGCWAYDSFGNRTMQVFQSGLCSTATPTAKYNANNQVTFAGQGFPSSVSAPNGFTYDPSGSGNVWFDGQNNYLYDGEGRVCAVQSTITGAMAAYIYDASGTRVAKGSITSPSCNMATNGFKLTNQYLLGLGGEQVTELSGTGAWMHSNVWAGSHLNATYDPKGLHFHLADPLGSRRVQLNAQGAVEETCQSLPFGDALQCILTSIASADDSTEHHFTGKERDAESGLDYFGARYYASSMGRWMSPDYSENSVILELPQSWNKYSYVLNRPTFGKDYDGRCPWCIGAAVGAVVEGGFDFGKQLYNNGGDLSAVNYREVGANALGGAVAGALAVATGGASLVESAVVGDIAAGGTANVVGGIVTRAAQGDNANEVLSVSEISQDAVSGFVGGGVGHLAGDVIHVPDEPIHNGRASTGAVRRDNAKFATYNNALRNQITRATVSGSAATHITNGGFSLFNWLFNQPPPPPPPPTPTRNCTINVTPDGTSGDC